MIRVVIAAAIWLLFIFSPQGASADSSICYDESRFTFCYPENMSLSKELVIDFFIFDFWIDGKVIMSAYLGFQPSFHFTKKETMTTRINGLDLKIAMQHDVERDLISKDVLIDLRDGTYLHFWYKNLQASEASINDSIIETVKLESSSGQQKPFYDRIVDWLRDIIAWP